MPRGWRLFIYRDLIGPSELVEPVGVAEARVLPEFKRSSQRRLFTERIVAFSSAVPDRVVSVRSASVIAEAA